MLQLIEQLANLLRHAIAVKGIGNVHLMLFDGSLQAAFNLKRFSPPLLRANVPY